MAREITRTGYSTLGVLAGLGGIAAVGFASIAVQLGGIGWILAFVVLVAVAVVLFWSSVLLFRRGRLHPPEAESAPPAGERQPS